MSKIKLLGVILLIAVLGGIFFISRDSQTSNPSDPNSVATVNGQSISRSEFDMRVAQISARVEGQEEVTEEQKQLVVEQMVIEELILQDAISQGLSVTQEEVDSQLETLKANFETPEAYQEALSAEGLTEDELKDSIQRGMTLEKYQDKIIADNNIEVTEEEIVASFEESTAGMENGPTLEEVRGQVEEQVRQQKLATIMQGIVENLRSKADIQILL